jgi:hypothetical protein
MPESTERVRSFSESGAWRCANLPGDTDGSGSFPAPACAGIQEAHARLLEAARGEKWLAAPRLASLDQPRPSFPHRMLPFRHYALHDPSTRVEVLPGARPRSLSAIENAISFGQQSPEAQ